MNVEESSRHQRTLSLLERARHGDREAFDRIFAEIEPRLLLYIRGRYHSPGAVGARVAAEDILQSTYVEALRLFPSFEYRGRGSFFRWMREIARLSIARTFDHHRRAARRDVRREHSLDASGPSAVVAPTSGVDTPSRAVYKSEKLDELSRALALLPEHYREVVMLHKLEERSFAETARLTHRSEAACKMIYFRAMTELRRRLDQD